MTILKDIKRVSLHPRLQTNVAVKVIDKKGKVVKIIKRTLHAKSMTLKSPLMVKYQCKAHRVLSEKQSIKHPAFIDFNDDTFYLEI